jgi:hypothetical protein
VRKFGWLLGCILFLGSSIQALAQVGADANDLGRGWDLRAGFFVPERQAPRSAEGDIWLTIGAERRFYETDRYIGTISIDYYGSGKIYNVPITVNARGETHRLRYGAGAGIGISHDLAEGKTGFTYNLLLGYVLTQGANPIVADVRYMYLSTGGGNLNGWAFTLGFRF